MPVKLAPVIVGPWQPTQVVMPGVAHRRARELGAVRHRRRRDARARADVAALAGGGRRHVRCAGSPTIEKLAAGIANVGAASCRGTARSWSVVLGA